MKPCNITSRSLVITRFSVSNKSPDLKCAISRICVYYFIVLNCCLHCTLWYINHKKIKGKECIYVTKMYIPPDR